MVEALYYKLQMFWVTTDKSANVFCDIESVYRSTCTPESVLKKKHHSISYHRCREAVADKTIIFVKQLTEKNLSDMFTNILTALRRRFLLEKLTYYDWHIPGKGREKPQMVFVLWEYFPVESYMPMYVDFYVCVPFTWLG